MLIRFYCIAIRSSQMLYLIGIKEISFLLHQISLDLQKHEAVITHAVSI